MAKLEWDKVGERTYETGCDRGVLFVMDSTGKAKKGVAWSGLTAVNESPSGAEATELYADNIKYLNLVSAETFGATIEAYDSPDEFDECDGAALIDSAAKGITVGQQARSTFAFAYRTMIGNDMTTEAGYKIHIIYGCLASPSGKDYSTINDSPEAATLSWEVKTTPVNVPGKKPTATIVIDSTQTEKTVLAAIEKYLYGDTETDSRLLMPDDIIAIAKNPDQPLPDAAA